MHETYFSEKKRFEIKTTFFETKNMFFKIKRYFCLKKTSFFIIFFSALKVCWKFVANFQSNFQGGLQVWLKLSMQTFRVGLKVSMQTFKAGLKNFCKRAGLHKNNIPKEVKTTLVVQSTLWALIENMFFVCLGLLTNNHRDLLLGTF